MMVYRAWIGDIFHQKAIFFPQILSEWEIKKATSLSQICQISPDFWDIKNGYLRLKGIEP